VEDTCDGCGICVERCFIQAMKMRDGKAVAARNAGAAGDAP